MLQPFCERRFRYSGVTRKGEEGIYLPLLAGILVALFLVVGLLVDSANLYLKQERLQHSADLAVESGLGYRILQGWAYFHGYNAAQDPYSRTNDDALRVRAGLDSARVAELVAIVQSTLDANFGSAVPATINYDNVADVVSVDVAYNTPLLILSSVPGYGGKFTKITIAARGQLSPANISMMLDHSGSMRCPKSVAGPDPCPCRTADRNCTTAYTNGVQNIAAVAANPNAVLLSPESKLFSLNRAARRFVSFFNPYRDRIALVPFSTLATRAFSFTAGRNPAAPNFGGVALGDLNTFYFALDSNFAQGNTNISDALRQSYQEVATLAHPQIIRNANPLRDQPYFGLLFTDGAPSAGIFHLTDVGPAITGSANPGANPWLHYTVEWFDGVKRWRGPSPFIFDNHTLTYTNFPGGEPPPNAVGLVCGRVAPIISDTTLFQDELKTSAGQCLRSWEFAPYAFAGNLSRRVGHNVQFSQNSDFTTTPAQASSYTYAQQYYHAAIELGDLFRADGGALFAVGLGNQALSSGNNDPYQNPDDDFSRKEFFLRRLAFDTEGAGVGGPVGTQDPEFELRTVQVNDPADVRKLSINRTVNVGYDGYRSYADLDSAVDGRRRGLYEGTDDPKEIQQIFVQVAKQILLRLTP
ncbi:MAG: VWA domain-containing protein [Bdellovibrionota bacterium]